MSNQKPYLNAETINTLVGEPLFSKISPWNVQGSKFAYKMEVFDNDPETTAKAKSLIATHIFGSIDVTLETRESNVPGVNSGIMILEKDRTLFENAVLAKAPHALLTTSPTFQEKEGHRRSGSNQVIGML